MDFLNESSHPRHKKGDGFNISILVGPYVERNLPICGGVGFDGLRLCLCDTVFCKVVQIAGSTSLNNDILQYCSAFLGYHSHLGDPVVLLNIVKQVGFME